MDMHICSSLQQRQSAWTSSWKLVVVYREPLFGRGIDILLMIDEKLHHPLDSVGPVPSRSSLAFEEAAVRQRQDQCQDDDSAGAQCMPQIMFARPHC